LCAEKERKGKLPVHLSSVIDAYSLSVRKNSQGNGSAREMRQLRDVPPAVSAMATNPSGVRWQPIITSLWYGIAWLTSPILGLLDANARLFHERHQHPNSLHFSKRL
jgi:hypothetical protein